MKTDLVKPCGECPFRRTSARGWLGPWEPDELLLLLGRGVFACHRTIPRDEVITDEDPRLQACAGAVIFLNNKCERSRHPDVAAHQVKMATVSAEISASVFQWSHEFLDHHKGGLLAASKSRKQPHVKTRLRAPRNRTIRTAPGRNRRP